MNKVILMGRLTKDPEISSSAGGTTFARYSIAVDRKFKQEGGPDADFFNCTSIGKQAEFVERYLKKGTKIVASGRLENNNYTDKEGHKVYGVRVITEEVEFAESKGSQQQTQNDVTELNITEQLPFDLPFS